MQFNKSQIISLLAERGQQEQAQRAERELPDPVDAEQHVLELGGFGLNLDDLSAALGNSDSGGGSPASERAHR